MAYNRKTLTIEIALDSDSIQDGANNEVARILMALASTVRKGKMDQILIRDSDGFEVGKTEVAEKTLSANWPRA